MVWIPPAQGRFLEAAGIEPAKQPHHRAGFEIVGVDLAPQPHYPFAFFREDALRVLEHLARHQSRATLGYSIDAIHASPPCQAFTAYKRRPDHVRDSPDLIAETRRLLRLTGLPYVIENVKGAPLEDPTMLCGGFAWPPPLGCRHKLWAPRFPAATNRKAGSRKTVEVGVWRIPLETQKRAMGVDWPVTLAELSQMVPPAYTELIGHQLLAHVRTVAA